MIQELLSFQLNMTERIGVELFTWFDNNFMIMNAEKWHLLINTKGNLIMKIKMRSTF